MLYAFPLLVALAIAAVAVRTFREGQQGETLDTAFRTAVIEALRFGAVFLVLGPPLGAVLMMLPNLYDVVTEPSGISAMLIIMLFSYLLGGLPSLVTGIVTSAAHPSLGTKWVVLIAAIAGVITSGLWLYGFNETRAELPWLSQIIAFFASGMLAYFYIRRRSAALPKQPATPVDP